MGAMFRLLKARTRSSAAVKSKRSSVTRGKAAVTFAARLTFDDVSRRFGDTLALDRVSIDVEPGEVLCLLGPSGCGKSTLLRIAAGVERPSSGRVLLDDQEVAGPDRFVPPEKRGIGLMFQDFALFPHLTILDNVAFGLKSLTRSEAKAEAYAALERVALGHYASEYPHILSGGEQQRVALARAIAPRPSVVLMDEPFSGLDPRLREKMREETLAILHETHATCIVVTHDAEEAMRMGNRVALLRKGRVVQTGKALDLYRAPKDILAARTFSDLNELPARVEQGSAVTPLGRFFAGGLPDGADAIVCVRQRGVRLLSAGQGCRGGSSIPASWATWPWSKLPCRASTRRSSPASGKATCRRKAPRWGWGSIPVRSSCFRPRKAPSRFPHEVPPRLATGLPLLP
jgi:iron(III) transport system ATP-binding protein